MADGFEYSSAPSPEDLAKFDLNHFGNAMRLIRVAGGAVNDDGEVDASRCQLLHVPGIGWVGYDKRRGLWDREQGEDLARRLAHRVAQTVRALATLWIDSGQRGTARDVMKFVDGCGNTGGTSGMLAQAQPYLTVKIDAFDRDPWAINCTNGTLRLRDKAGGFSPHLTPHDPADRITRQAACAWLPDGPAPELFLRVVKRSLPTAEERGAFQRWLGYCCTGVIHEQAFALTQGKGNDGKSTILDACREAVGTYGAVGNILSFLDVGLASGTGPDPELVKLAGDVRLVILSEPQRGQKLHEGRLKAWTSGSPISARDLQAKPITFRPTGKLTFECNELPGVKGADDGIWRRVTTPIFRHQVPAAEVDKTLQARIRESELPGVLAWLVAGVGDWMARGLDPPASWTAVKDEYRKSSSPLAEWLTERCVFGDAAKGEEETSKALYDDYKAWSDDNGHEKPVAQRAFGDFLRGKQVFVRKSHGTKIRTSIRFKTADERDRDEAAGPSAAQPPSEPPAGGSPAPGPPPASSSGSGVGDRSRGAGGFDLPPDDDDAPADEPGDDA